MYNGYRVSSLGVKRPRRGVDHEPHLAATLKKEWTYTVNPPPPLFGTSWPIVRRVADAEPLLQI
jgi:hypothetical protein